MYQKNSQKKVQISVRSRIYILSNYHYAETKYYVYNEHPFHNMTLQKSVKNIYIYQTNLEHG